MSTVISLRLPLPVARRLSKLAGRLGVAKSLLIRQALDRYLLEVQFEELRRRMRPYAERRGLVTDEDVFARVS
ncbi:MAG TPA: ribbon-helix-helix protein, CopG family [Planctomycetota bacterium]|jgi:predicted transcriptional regulator|nr:ribbon-helix-helix protein, CopG family [Planctomycetota bacterium]